MVNGNWIGLAVRFAAILNEARKHGQQKDADKFTEST